MAAPYDEAGNLTARTDALVQETSYEYDALNRLTRISTDNPDEADVVIRYDKAGADNGIGRITTVNDGAGETTYDYTETGEVSSVTRSIDGDIVSLGYTYDAAGLIETITYPSGHVVGYERNATGEVAHEGKWWKALPCHVNFYIFHNMMNLGYLMR